MGEGQAESHTVGPEAPGVRSASCLLGLPEKPQRKTTPGGWAREDSLAGKLPQLIKDMKKS